MNDSCFSNLSCSFVLNSPEKKFNYLHTSLSRIIELHEYEKYFQEELSILEKVKEEHQTLMQWLKKNEKSGTDDFD